MMSRESMIRYNTRYSPRLAEQRGERLAKRLAHPPRVLAERADDDSNAAAATGISSG